MVSPMAVSGVGDGVGMVLGNVMNFSGSEASGVEAVFLGVVEPGDGVVLSLNSSGSRS